MKPIPAKLRQPLPPSAHSQGMVMIETLVAILIISFGLLGYAGLLLQSIKANLTAYQRSQATAMAYDIADAMRANRFSATEDGAYNIAFGAAAGSGSTVAAADMVRWKANLSRNLPSGDGSIQVDGNGIATIRIRWSNTSQVHAGEGSTTTFVTQTQI